MVPCERNGWLARVKLAMVLGNVALEGVGRFSLKLAKKHKGSERLLKLQTQRSGCTLPQDMRRPPQGIPHELLHQLPPVFMSPMAVYKTTESRRILVTRRARDPYPPPPPRHGTILSPGVPPCMAGATQDGPESWSAIPMPTLPTIRSGHWAPLPRHARGPQKPRQKLHETAAGPAPAAPPPSQHEDREQISPYYGTKLCGLYTTAKADAEAQCNILWKALDKIAEIKSLLEERWIAAKIADLYNDSEPPRKTMRRGC
ncbi:hypothetical protein QTO34_011408 [Cnephaeus nilssonii]|uniref:Uncharacterized protein n=1 Tax=Cnephaeus nilssonii TaxID=3371016 RepID=A0AA40HDQ6_CNENI|nr:hypothetical protein QTO34_011408 [Eptesicus nilssonii]